jgi:5'-3' exoribonuclease 1
MLHVGRARRFRSAKDTEENVKTALAKGVAMDVENLFDSNCITPGTEFMAKV